MTTNVSTTRVVTHDPVSEPGYGPCLWCAGPAGFLAHEGPFCSDEHVSAHRFSEQRLRDDLGFIDFLRAVAR